MNKHHSSAPQNVSSDAKAQNSARFSSRYFLLLIGATNAVEYTSKNAELLTKQESIYLVHTMPDTHLILTCACRSVI